MKIKGMFQTPKKKKKKGNKVHLNIFAAEISAIFSCQSQKTMRESHVSRTG